MSSDKQQQMRDIAADAERDLNTYQSKTGAAKTGVGLSANESGVDTSTANKFPGSSVMYGSEATGRKIAPSEGGGDIPGGPNAKFTRPATDKDFEGLGGPAEKLDQKRRDQAGHDDAGIYH